MSGKTSSMEKLAGLYERAQILVEEQERSVQSLTLEEMVQRIEEFKIYQIELEMQNEDLRQVQLELEDSRQKYRDLYHFAPIGYLTLSEKGVVTEANRAAGEMLGLERLGLIDLPLTAFIVPEDQDIFFSHWRNLLAAREMQLCRLRLFSRYGGVVHVQLQTTIFEGDDRCSTRFLAVLHDVTRLVAVKNELRDSEQKFRTIADYTYNWEYWLGLDGRLQYTSPSCERFTGYTVDEFMENPDLLVSVVDPDDQGMFRKHLADHLHCSHAKAFDYQIRTKDGVNRWVSHTCQAVYDGFGKLCGRRASILDITARKELEEKLLDSQKLMRMALDASSDGMWDRNLLTGEAFYGANWYKTLGYTREYAVEHGLTWDNLLHADDRPKAHEALDAYISGRTSIYEVEFRMLNSSGNWQWFLSRGKILEYDGAGNPSRLVGTHEDITDRKCFEAELQQARLDLEEKVRERTKDLEETNIALNILLKKRTSDKSDLEQHILKTLSQFVEPYVDKLKSSRLSREQKDMVSIMEINIQELTSSFSSSLAAVSMRLTPMENQVANLVKIGRQTKEIAEMLHLSSETISVHRKNIRKKMGLTNKKQNLQTTLSAKKKAERS